MSIPKPGVCGHPLRHSQGAQHVLLGWMYRQNDAFVTNGLIQLGSKSGVTCSSLPLPLSQFTHPTSTWRYYVVLV